MVLQPVARLPAAGGTTLGSQPSNLPSPTLMRVFWSAWALNQRAASSRRAVETALYDLARTGRLLVSTGADGRCRYRQKP